MQAEEESWRRIGGRGVSDWGLSPSGRVLPLLSPLRKGIDSIRNTFSPRRLAMPASSKKNAGSASSAEVRCDFL